MTNQTVYAFLPDGFSFGLGYPMVAASLLFILVLSNQRLQRFLEVPVLQYLGYISYAIYVIHTFVIGTFSSWLFIKLFPYLGYSWTLLLVFFSGVMVSILLAHLVTIWVDGPTIKLARWLGNLVKTVAQKRLFNEPLKWIEKYLLRHRQVKNSENS